MLHSLFARTVSLSVCVAAVLLQDRAMAVDEPQKIAVVPFASQVPPQRIGGADVGKEIAKLLSTRLAEGGAYAPVPQKAVERALANLGGRYRLNTRNAAQFGAYLGVDALVIGTVKDYSMVQADGARPMRTVKRVARRTGAYVPYAGGVISALTSGIDGPTYRISVSIDTKLVEVGGGKTLATVSGTGESRKSTSTLWKKPDTIDFTSSSFASSAAGEATNMALDPVCEQLLAAAGDVKTAAFNNARGEIVAINDDDEVSVNIGSFKGLKVGDALNVERALRLARPGHGAPRATEVGIIVLTKVEEDHSRGTLRSAKQPLQVGDLVRPSGASRDDSSPAGPTVGRYPASGTQPGTRKVPHATMQTDAPAHPGTGTQPAGQQPADESDIEKDAFEK
jgi:hypothetical protein